MPLTVSVFKEMKKKSHKNKICCSRRINIKKQLTKLLDEAVVVHMMAWA